MLSVVSCYGKNLFFLSNTTGRSRTYWHTCYVILYLYQPLYDYRRDSMFSIERRLSLASKNIVRRCPCLRLVRSFLSTSIVIFRLLKSADRCKYKKSERTCLGAYEVQGVRCARVIAIRRRPQHGGREKNSQNVLFFQNRLIYYDNARWRFFFFWGEEG